MGFKKYQKVESSEVVTPEGHKLIESTLKKEGKTSVSQLDEDERKDLTEKLDTTDNSSIV